MVGVAWVSDPSALASLLSDLLSCYSLNPILYCYVHSPLFFKSWSRCSRDDHFCLRNRRTKKNISEFGHIVQLIGVEGIIHKAACNKLSVAGVFYLASQQVLLPRRFTRRWMFSKTLVVAPKRRAPSTNFLASLFAHTGIEPKNTGPVKNAFFPNNHCWKMIYICFSTAVLLHVIK